MVKNQAKIILLIFLVTLITGQVFAHPKYALTIKNKSSQNLELKNFIPEAKGRWEIAPTTIPAGQIKKIILKNGPDLAQGLPALQITYFIKSENNWLSLFIISRNFKSSKYVRKSKSSGFSKLCNIKVSANWQSSTEYKYDIVITDHSTDEDDTSKKVKPSEGIK